MGVKVVKFGGSSVADAIQLQKTKEIITSDPDRKFVIVSAPGKRFDGDTKITDLLYLCKTHIEHNLPYEQLFQVVCDRFRVTEVNLGVTVDLNDEFEAIKKELEKGATADYIASRGEYLNAIVIAAYLGYDFVDAAGLVKFNDKGRFLPEETNEALKEELAKHERVVMPGFYGAKPDGSIVTFSRGGSDITGSLVARAVEADVYENWTDVSGLLVADPRIVPEAKPIGTISYKALRELSYMGASVLHEDAVFPVRKANIPINIRNTNRPQDPGTMITAEPSKHEGQVISGIAGKKDFTVIAIYKTGLSDERGFIRRLAGIFEDYDLPIEHLPNGIDTASVVTSSKLIDGHLDEVLEEIEQQIKPNEIEVIEDMCLIATVGYGMAYRPGTAATLFKALADAGINIRMIDQGSSEMNIIVGVDNKHKDAAIKAIYNAFEA